MISKGLYENETFLKTSINGKFDFTKRPERPNTKSSKIACLSKAFFCRFTQATTGACILHLMQVSICTSNYMVCRAITD